MARSAVAGVSIRDTAAWDLCQIHLIYNVYTLEVLKRCAGEGQRKSGGRWCEKFRSIAWSQEGKEYPTYSKGRKANWIGHIVHKNCLLNHVTEGKKKVRIKVTGRRGRRCKQPLDDLKERRGYWVLKEEELDRPLWRSCFESGCGPVVRQSTKSTKRQMLARLAQPF